MTAESDERLFRLALARMYRWMLLFSAGGCVAMWIAAGWQSGVGFLLGALASGLNFRWLKQLVSALGEQADSARSRRGARVAVILGLRYLLLGFAAYVILTCSTLSLPAALAGLFVAVAAVLVEIVFQLVYARN